MRRHLPCSDILAAILNRGIADLKLFWRTLTVARRPGVAAVPGEIGGGNKKGSRQIRGRQESRVLELFHGVRAAGFRRKLPKRL